jgi:TonB family protein
MENLVLVRKTFTGYQLRLPVDSIGTFRKAGSSLDLDQLVAWGFASRRSGWYLIPLNKDMSGEFSLHGASFRLTFAEQSRIMALSETPVTGILPIRYRFGVPDRNDMVFMVILLLIFVLQILTVRSLSNYPIPEITSIKELPRRISRLILEPVAPPPVSRIVKPVSPDTEGEATGPVKEPVPVEEPSVAEQASPLPKETLAAPTPLEEPTPGVGRDAIRRQVSKIGVLGVLTGGSGTGDQEGSGTGLIEIEGILDDKGVGDQIQISRLGEASEATESIGTSPGYVEEIIQPELRDERSSRVISRVVGSHTGAIRYAYNRELRKNPALHGKIVLTFTISPAGSVTECTVEESEMDWPPLEDSLVRMVLGWKFPEIPEGTVTVSYPLVFFPSM